MVWLGFLVEKAAMFMLDSYRIAALGFVSQEHCLSIAIFYKSIKKEKAKKLKLLIRANFFVMLVPISKSKIFGWPTCNFIGHLEFFSNKTNQNLIESFFLINQPKCICDIYYFIFIVW